MISKNMTKLIRSLENKKNRERTGLFIAEGPKIVSDLIAVSQPKTIIATQEWLDSNPMGKTTESLIVTEDELRKISFLQHPQQVLGIFPIPQQTLNAEICNKELCLALDKVQDPGNLGTIIRIADWFGISTILCNEGTADAYNPKVVQATMGSIARVKIVYTDLVSIFDTLPDNTPIYATSLDGDNIYSQELSPTGVIVMGNEGNGVSTEVMNKVNRTLFIPSYRKTRNIDSLNVAIATAITCAEFKRRNNTFKLKQR